MNDTDQEFCLNVTIKITVCLLSTTAPRPKSLAMWMLHFRLVKSFSLQLCIYFV